LKICPIEPARARQVLAEFDVLIRNSSVSTHRDERLL